MNGSESILTIIESKHGPFPATAREGHKKLVAGIILFALILLWILLMKLWAS